VQGGYGEVIVGLIKNENALKWREPMRDTEGIRSKELMQKSPRRGKVWGMYLR